MIVTNIEDLRRCAQRRLPRALFDYVDCGSYSEQTLRMNRDDFRAIGLRQRVGINVAKRTTETTLLGRQISMPVVIAPTGLAGLMRGDGEMLAARAADRFGIPYTLSTVSICSIEDVAEVVTQPFWFQLYVFRDREFTASLISRAKAAGCSTLLVTLDTAVTGKRYRDIKNGLSVPPKLTVANALEMMTKPGWALSVLAAKRKTFGNFAAGAGTVPSGPKAVTRWIATQTDPSLCWEDVRRIRDQWSGKLLVKGILDPRDACAAVDIGADGIIVSNHGGRQLDGAASSVSVLPSIVDVVRSRCEILLDSGVQSGRDVLTGTALGAKSCMLGKAHLYGLAAMGEAGVAKVLEMIHAELSACMALTGITTLRDAGPQILRMPAHLSAPASASGAPHPLAAGTGRPGVTVAGTQ